MNLFETFIYPPLKINKTANKMKILVNELRLFEFVRLTVLLYSDTNDELIETKIITIDGPNYKCWGNEDKFIVDYVKNVLQNEG
jgi:hypothetical protein